MYDRIELCACKIFFVQISILYKSLLPRISQFYVLLINIKQCHINNKTKIILITSKKNMQMVFAGEDIRKNSEYYDIILYYFD